MPFKPSTADPILYLSRGYFQVFTLNIYFEDVSSSHIRWSTFTEHFSSPLCICAWILTW